MAEASYKVVYSDIAHQQIFAIMFYIARQGYPETAIKFVEELYDFGQSLGIFPEKYSICKRRPFAIKKLRCAPFEQYLFVYRIDLHKIIIHAIIHSSRMK